MYIGIDIGGTNIRIGLLNKEFKIIKEELFKVDEIVDFNQFFHEELKLIINENKVEFIAVGIPGIFNKETNELVNLPNIKLDSDIFVKLEEELKIKIVLHNDANSLLMAHIKTHELNDYNVLGFYIGTGFGSAIYINKEIYTGDNNKAAEIGHTKVLGNNLLCGCGSRGCLETLVSGKRLHDLHRMYPYFKFNSMFNHLNEIHELNTFLDLLAITIANNIIYFDINNVILGGGVVNRPDFPLTLLKSKIYKHTDPRNVNIYISETNEIDGVLGAILLTLEK